MHGTRSLRSVGLKGVNPALIYIYITLKSLFLFAGSRVVPGALEEGVCPENGRAGALAEGDPGVGAVRLLYRGGVVL